MRRASPDRMDLHARMRSQNQRIACDRSGEESYLPSSLRHQRGRMNQRRIGPWIRRLDEQNAGAQLATSAFRRLIHRNQNTRTGRRLQNTQKLAADCSQELAVEH